MFGSWGVITLWEAPHTVGDTVNISGTHATTIVNIMNILGAFFLRKVDKHFRHKCNHHEHFGGFFPT